MTLKNKSYMSLHINNKDPDLIDAGFDYNGEFVMSYQGNPFTGIQVWHFSNNPSVIAEEVEYKNGHINGLVREYHPNGILAEEYATGEGGLDGRRREWDTNGVLLSDKFWIKGVRQ